jgi:hypothetical protein
MNQGNRYGHPMARKPATQVWAHGETVKVGFLSLRIVGGDRNRWTLVNAAGTKHYAFEPHVGLFAL